VLTLKCEDKTFVFNVSTGKGSKNVFFWIAYLGSEEDAYGYQFKLKLQDPIQNRVKMMNIIFYIYGEMFVSLYYY
jgi:hypothetical protein